uniref:SDR family oxidoreductase n=1 Tax=Trichocoleus desertorum TaxID=1481672 RepID=UPI0025B3EE8D|nr:SDR family oxidoreductase [Trichocoleus desertorum]
MTSASHVFLAGASRGVGREIARCLVEQGIKATALLRSEAARSELEALGITVVLGDALNLDAVEQAMQGAPVQAVVSTVGGLPKDGERADYLGNKNLVDAAVKAGVQKFILVSSIGSGDSIVALSPQALETLKPVLIEKEKAEQHLIESGLTYTIVRPGGLKSELATGNAVLTEDPKVSGMIHRADVANLVCQCLQSNRANNKTLSAIDRQMLFVPVEFAEFSLN